MNTLMHLVKWLMVIISSLIFIVILLASITPNPVPVIQLFVAIFAFHGFVCASSECFNKFHHWINKKFKWVR